MKEFKSFFNSVRKSATDISEEIGCNFKAIFVTGGPGSGKDIFVRCLVSTGHLTELNYSQAIDVLGNKQKLSESSSDARREAIRNRQPLVINGSSEDKDHILQIKEELEDLGYSTLMVFVNTSNETSKTRNTQLTRMIAEGVRLEKWHKSQRHLSVFQENFRNFIDFDNNPELGENSEYITETLNDLENFLFLKQISEIAKDWIKKKRMRKLNDNNSPFMQMQAKAGKIDKVTDGDIKTNGGYTFRAYHEQKEPVLIHNKLPKESNFSMDADKVRARKSKFSAAPQKQGRMDAPGVGAQYDTRRQGSVMPLGGLGEAKDFGSFRKSFKSESFNDPGGNEMGTINNADRKEPMQVTQDKTGQDSPPFKKTKKKGK